MYTVQKTKVYDAWFRSLRDERAKARINTRLRRVEEDGNFGYAASVGKGVSKMKIDYGPGYRLHFIQSGAELILLLCGGDKRTQQRDIDRAHRLAREFDAS